MSQATAVKSAGRREANIPLDLSAWNFQVKTDEVFDVVIHIAADFGGNNDADYARAEMVNSVGTLSACSLASQVQAKHFVLISSIFATYSPQDPYYGIYSLSKRHSEEVAQFYCSERKLDLTILRPSQVYDDAELCRPHQEFLYRIADKAEAGKPVELFGSHDARRNYIHLSDLIECINRVIHQRLTGVFTCANPQSVTLSEMAHAAYRAFGTAHLGQVVFLKDRQDLLDLPPLNEFELYSKIQFRPGIGIEEGYKRIQLHREIHS